MAALSSVRVKERATGLAIAEFDVADVEPPGVPMLVRGLGPGVVEIVVDGWRFELVVEDVAQAGLRERATRAAGARGVGGPIEVRAIIPGRVTSVAVAEGDVVEAGQRLLAVEAMKMENDVRAPRSGSVRQVAVGAGATVDVGDLLVVLE